MDQEAVLDAVARFRKELEARGIHPEKVVLHGMDAAHNGEVIDLIVISNDFKNTEYWERIHILAEAICALFLPIEAVAMTLEEWERGESLSVQYGQDSEEVM